MIAEVRHDLQLHYYFFNLEVW